MKPVDWQTALEYVANGLRQIKADHGARRIGAGQPHSTVEELYLAGALVRGLGSDNIDHRLRNAEFVAVGNCPLARHLHRFPVQPAARSHGGFQPAQGPSPVRSASARRAQRAAGSRR